MGLQCSNLAQGVCTPLGRCPDAAAPSQAGTSRSSLQQLAGPLIVLRVTQASIKSSSGARLTPFGFGDEVAVVQVEKLKGWDALRWRQEHWATQRAVSDSGQKLWPPRGPRFENAQRFWGAKVVSTDGQGGFEEYWCLLQVAASPEQRIAENARAALDDARDVAAYTDRFNQRMSDTHGSDDTKSVPSLRVCTPVGCTVIGGNAPDLASLGETVLVIWYPSPRVQKFVFDGSEDFLELPQAFFHYVAFLSRGWEQVADLQGVRDGHDVYLVDPVVLRTPEASMLSTLSGISAGGTQRLFEPETAASDLRFEQWHPRCGELCKVFDPNRSTMKSRRHGLFAVGCNYCERCTIGA